MHAFSSHIQLSSNNLASSFIHVMQSTCPPSLENNIIASHDNNTHAPRVASTLLAARCSLPTQRNTNTLVYFRGGFYPE